MDLRRSLLVAVLVAGAIFPLGLFVADLTGHGLAWIGRDFFNLWAAGKLPKDVLYDIDAYRDAIRTLGNVAVLNTSYPPLIFPFADLLALFPYEVAFAIFTAIGIFLWFRATREYGWLAITPAFWWAVSMGHYGLIVGALWIWAFRAPSGGLLIFKPHMGVLLAPALLKDRTLFLRTCAVALLFVLASLAYGIQPWIEYFAKVPGAQAEILMQKDRAYSAMMPTAYVNIGLWTQVASSIAAIALCWRLRRLPLDELCFPLATATFLILPYAFIYDMTVVMLAWAILIPRVSTGRAVVLAAAIILSGLQFVTWTKPVAVWLAFLIQWEEARRTVKPASNPRVPLIS